MTPEIWVDTAGEAIGLSAIFTLIAAIPGLLVGLAAYIATAYGLYTISNRRGLSKPWLAWIPIVNGWTLGAIADDYRLKICGERKSRRKLLLGTGISVNVLSIGVLIPWFAVLFSIMEGYSTLNGAALIAALVLCVPMLAVSVVHAVFYYIALFDLYKSCEPKNATVYLVLSILISYCLPIFLVVCSRKDEGMKLQQRRSPASAEPWQQSEE